MSQLTEVRATIRAIGDVQRVGFRYRVESIARKVGVKGYVENVEDGTVKIVCEGNKEAVDQFANKIKIKGFPINVEKLEIEFSKPTGEFKALGIKYGKLEEELAEGLGAGIAHLTRLSREVGGLRSDMKGEFSLLRSDMKSEFSSLRSDIKKLRLEIREAFSLMDKRYSDISKTLKRLADDFRKLVRAYLSKKKS